MTDGIIKTSETVYTDINISNLFFDEKVEVTFESLILVITFFIPLIFSLLPVFSNWKKIVKRATQILFSSWFAYNSYLIVFSIGSPLIAGWTLSITSVLFVILCVIECIPMKHNKLNQLDAQKTRTSV